MALTRCLLCLAVVALGGCTSPPSRSTSDDACPSESPGLAPAAESHALKTVFLILFENKDWNSIAGSSSAPYINGTLLPTFAHADNYRNGGLHPSLPNYILLEAGSNLGVTFDAPPKDVPLPVPCHLVSYFEATGLSWKAYEEGIDGSTCPIDDQGKYAVRHDPFVYFEDVSGSPPSRSSSGCIAHVRPYSELAGDLAAGRVARYSFITPNICDSGHDSCAPLHDPIRQSDAWLARELPGIMASPAFQSGGVIFITWDEPAAGDAPIGMIVVSPLAKQGYASPVACSHASTLRTIEEILGVTPLLRRAATATPLSDLFSQYP
jgi:hypothetical protein